MMGRKIISGLGGILWILILCLGTLFFQRPTLEQVSGLLAMSENMTCYLVDNTKQRPVIYEVDSGGNIVNFCRLCKEEGTQKVIGLFWNGDGLSLLEQIGKGEDLQCKIYDCGPSLQEQLLVANFSIPRGETILQLMQGQEKEQRLIFLGREKQRIRVCRIAPKKGDVSETEELAEISAGEREWFCGAAYYEDRTYIVNNYGRARCFQDTKRQKQEALDQRQITGMTASRAGIFLQSGAGKLELLSKEGMQTMEVADHLLALDAMSAKANIQMGLDLQKGIFLSFCQPDGVKNVSKLKMNGGMLIRYGRESLFAAAALGAVSVLLVLGIVFWGKKKRKKPGSICCAALCQAGMGILLLAGTRAGYHALICCQQENIARALAASAAQKLQNIDFSSLRMDNVSAELCETLREYLSVQEFELNDGQACLSLEIVNLPKIQQNDAVAVAASIDIPAGGDFCREETREALPAVQEAADSGIQQRRVIESGLSVLDARSRIWVVLPLGDRIRPEVFLAAKVETRLANQYGLLSGIFLWLAVEIGLYLSWGMIQRRRMRRFAQAVEAAVKGTAGKKTQNFGGTFAPAWMEIQKQAVRLENKKIQQKQYQQDYRRFVPEQFAGLMGRDSIQDIQIGETRRAEATFWGIWMEGTKEFEKNRQTLQDMNWLLEEICRENLPQIIFTEGTNLGNFSIVYEEQARQAVDVAVRIWRRANERARNGKTLQASFLLHAGTSVCGLAGTGQAAFPFVCSQEMEILKNYGRRLQKARVRLVVTEELLFCLSPYRYRYIGYAAGGRKEKPFRFYEILEAYPDKERKQFVKAAQTFAEALNLFAQNDFYLARSQFLEVLKDCPKDGLAKHYLFLCEQMFHETDSAKIRHELFAGED